jgi:hypothetical protein
MKAQNNLQSLDRRNIVELFNNKIYIPNYEHDNSIFYFVREPSIRPFNENMINVDEYIKYLHFMEGSAKKIKLKNFCFEGMLIMDGSFSIPLVYDEELEITVGNSIIKSISEFL